MAGKKKVILHTSKIYAVELFWFCDQYYNTYENTKKPAKQLIQRYNRAEAVLHNTWANGIVVNKSNKYT